MRYSNFNTRLRRSYTAKAGRSVAQYHKNHPQSPVSESPASGPVGAQASNTTDPAPQAPDSAASNLSDEPRCENCQQITPLTDIAPQDIRFRNQPNTLTGVKDTNWPIWRCAKCDYWNDCEEENE